MCIGDALEIMLMTIYHSNLVGYIASNCQELARCPLRAANNTRYCGICFRVAKHNFDTGVDEMRVVGLVDVQGPPIWFFFFFFFVPHCGVYCSIMSSRRSYNAPSSQELAVVGNLHGQPAERIGGIMLMIYAMLPAPGRSNDVPNPRNWLLFMP